MTGATHSAIAVVTYVGLVAVTGKLPDALPLLDRYHYRPACGDSDQAKEASRAYHRDAPRSI